VSAAAEDLAGGRARARLDQLLVERGLFDSREKARRAVMAGVVEVDGRRLDKPGTAVAAGARIAWPPRSTTSRSIPPGSTAWTSAPRPAASPTACCSAARGGWWRSTSERT
jgi:hypothetical protein